MSLSRNEKIKFNLFGELVWPWSVANVYVDICGRFSLKCNN